MPAVGQIGHGEEFQCESQFDESEDDLQCVHPGARLRCGLQPRGEHGEEGEGQGQGQGKAEHADSRSQPVAGSGGLYEQHADDGGCAGEGDQYQGEGHEEDRDQSAGLCCLRIDSVGPTAWQADFKPSEEGEGEHDQQEEYEDVEHRICRHGIEGVGAEERRDKQS